MEIIFLLYIFLVQVRLRQMCYASPFDPTGVRTHNPIDSTFHVPEMHALTTEPSGTS